MTISRLRFRDKFDRKNVIDIDITNNHCPLNSPFTKQYAK